MSTRSKKRVLLLSAVLLALLGLYAPPAQAQGDPPVAKYVILLISDGWGIRHIEATNDYAGETPSYQAWARYWMSHYPAGGSYDPSRAWAEFDYVKSGTTDSAASATALYSGLKTSPYRISVSAGGERLYTIGDKARALGKAVGAVSSVWLSDATPGAWYAHNDDRTNRYAIADEGFFGDPDTTGAHAGDHGPTWPPAQVIIGGRTSGYVSDAIRDKLFAESGQLHKHRLVERIPGSPDGGPRLLAAANDPGVAMLAGLFDQVYRLADGSGYDPENPTLAHSAIAALAVLNRNPNGFVLLVESGAGDWASHDNDMDRMIGEQIGFDRAVQAVIDWVEEPGNGSEWQNTLVIVTGDHETGYLTAGPGVFPDQPLGQVDAGTLAKEKTVSSSGRRASWDDLDGDDEIDAGETVYWAWNSSGHTNSLTPLYANGVGSDRFDRYATGSDPVRGAYLDNTHVFRVMDAVLTAWGTVALSIAKAVVPSAGVTYHGPVTYTVALANDGTRDARDVWVTDTLPVSTTFGAWVERPAGASIAGQDITWRGTVTAGEAITFTFAVSHSGDYGEVVTNTASYRHDGETASAEAAFAVRSGPVLSIAKAANPRVDVARHGTVTYTVALANRGESGAAGVWLTDTLPVSTTFGAWVERPAGASIAGQDITWRGTVTAGEAITLAFVVRHSGDYRDRVSNTAVYDHAGHTGSATATFTVRGPIRHSLYLPMIVAAG